MLSGLERFLVEFVRRNDETVAGLTTPQIESLVLMVVGTIWIAVASRQPEDCGATGVSSRARLREHRHHAGGDDADVPPTDRRRHSPESSLALPAL